jgi:hypothetical protein
VGPRAGRRANETRNNYYSLNIFSHGIILLLYLSWTSHEVFKKVLNHLFRTASSVKKDKTPVRFDPVDGAIRGLWTHRLLHRQEGELIRLRF